MLGSTRELLNNARIYFDELGYHFHIMKDDIDYNKFIDCFCNTINHSKTFEDAIEAIRMFKYLDKKFNKIIKAIYKYPEYFDSLEYGKNEILSLVSDEEAIGTYHVSNALYNDWKEIIVFGQSVDGSFGLMYEDSKFYVYKDDPEYFLRYSHLSYGKMVLLDKNNNKLAVIKLNKDLNIEINNNTTNYEIVDDDGIMLFYRKGEKEKSEDNVDAIMNWDILDKNSEVGLTRFVLYDENADFELITLLAASCLLLYKGSRRSSGIMATSVILSSHSAYRH